MNSFFIADSWSSRFKSRIAQLRRQRQTSHEPVHPVAKWRCPWLEERCFHTNAMSNQLEDDLHIGNVYEEAWYTIRKAPHPAMDDKPTAMRLCWRRRIFMFWHPSLPAEGLLQVIVMLQALQTSGSHSKPGAKGPVFKCFLGPASTNTARNTSSSSSLWGSCLPVTQSQSRLPWW